MCEDQILSFCRPLCPPGTRIAVAVSGGPDSIALLHLLHALRERLALSTLAVAHVNHGLRGEESDREEAFVVDQARRLGCPVHLEHLRGRDPDAAGMEAWARAQRYRFFAHLREKNDYRWIATGHTADDQAETVLMRLLRGSGLTGLAGIRAVREDGIFRPLLPVSRKELLQWMHQRQISWCHDSSNDNVKYRRNWLRHNVLPLIEEQYPGAARRLSELAGDASQIRQLIDPAVNNWLKDHVIEKSDDRIILSKPQSTDYGPIATEAVAQLLREKNIGFSRADILRFFAESQRNDGTFLLPDQWRFYPGRDRIAIERHRGDRPVTTNVCHLTIPGTTACAELGWIFTAALQDPSEMPGECDHSNREVWLDAAATGTQLCCRVIEKEELFHPLGAEGPRNLHGYLKKQKVPRWERETVRVVARADGAVVWIPTLAIGHPFRVTEHTKEVLRLSCRREAEV